MTHGPENDAIKSTPQIWFLLTPFLLPGAACWCSAAVFFGSSRAPLTSRLDKDFGPPHCLSDFLLLGVAPFLLLVHAYGTIYLRVVFDLYLNNLLSDFINL